MTREYQAQQARSRVLALRLALQDTMDRIEGAREGSVHRKFQQSQLDWQITSLVEAQDALCDVTGRREVS